MKFQNFHLGQVVTSCEIVAWALQDEIKSFNISKLHFNMVIGYNL